MSRNEVLHDSLCLLVKHGVMATLPVQSVPGPSSFFPAPFRVALNFCG